MDRERTHDHTPPTPDPQTSPQPARPSQTTAPGHPLLHLQRLAGNHFVGERLARRAAGSDGVAPGPATSAALNSAGRGNPLPASTRAHMERALGADLGNVQVHSDGQAAAAAQELNAAAFTSGRDVYFGQDRYQPSTSRGRRLLAHELTHTVQQNRGSSSPARSPMQASQAVSQPGDALEREAETVADRVTTGRPVPPGTISTTDPHTQRAIARQGEGETSAPTASPPVGPPRPGAGTEEGAASLPVEPVSLVGTGTFDPSPAVASYLEAQGTADVPVRLGNLAAGRIKVRKRGENYDTVRPREQAIPFTHPALEPLRGAGVQPMLALRIRSKAISGYATIARGERFISRNTALIHAIKEHSDALGWVGLDLGRFPRTSNALENGVLRLQVNDFNFRLAGFLDGTGTFGLENEAVTFNANATIHVEGLTDAQLELSRNPEGNLAGQVEVPVSFAKFSGNVLAQYDAGTVNIRGTVRYTDEKFSGELTLLVTDAATARNVALEHLGPEAVQAAGEENGGQQGGRRRRGRANERALAGWGTLDFAFTEWLSGKAQVIVDNEGHITVIGEITPQAEVELFPQRDYIYNIFTVEIRTLYGVPLVGNVFLFANIGMDALAKLGPGKIYNIAVRGRYSTDPRVFNEFSIEATLNISAFAGLRLRAEGGAGVEVAGHDIKAGVGLNALAGIRGYVEAVPRIGYREKASPEEGRAGEFYFNGHMELAAQPFLGLSGDLFVELDSPWWSPAPDKKWTWPLGQLEYPLPGEFGIGADVDYVIGSGEIPQIEMGEVDFNSEKFMTDLINDHVPPKSHGEQEQQGEWQEGETTGESAEPQQVDSQGAPPQDQPARGRQEAGEGEVPAPNIQQRWQQGMRALGRLAERSRQDPFTQAQIDAELAQLKNRYGFTELRATPVGEDWRVLARMNPDNASNPLIVEGEEAAAGEGAGPTAPTPPSAPTGKTRNDPIPMIWFKPPGLYPMSIGLGDERYFFNEPEPLVVPPVAGLPDVRRSGFTSGEIVIGIDTSGEFFPKEGRVWPRVLASPLRTGVKQRNFRNLLTEYGYDWGTKEADHVRDLQWGGQDDYANLWPLERTWNNAANRILDQDVTYLDDSGNVVTVKLKQTPLDRWFKIDGIRRP